MPYRVNGIGTTMTPIPKQGQYSVAIHWFTVFFIPVLPLGWQVIQGAGGNSYYVVKRISFQQARESLGVVGVARVIAWSMGINLAMFTFAVLVIFLFSQMRRHL